VGGVSQYNSEKMVPLADLEKLTILKSIFFRYFLYFQLLCFIFTLILVRAIIKILSLRVNIGKNDPCLLNLIIIMILFLHSPEAEKILDDFFEDKHIASAIASFLPSFEFLGGEVKAHKLRINDLCLQTGLQECWLNVVGFSGSMKMTVKTFGNQVQIVEEEDRIAICHLDIDLEDFVKWLRSDMFPNINPEILILKRH